MKKQKITLLDIAKELKTTPSTVSRALQDHPRISQSMKIAVWNLTKKLNYHPNSNASSLRKGKGNTIGVVVPRVDRNFFSTVIRGIEDIAINAGYSVIISQSYDSLEREKTIINKLSNGVVDGLLVSLGLETKNYKHFQNVINRGIPIVFFDRVPDMPVPKVEINDFAGAFMAVEHLISQGCKRIAHFCGPSHISIYKNRFDGYKAALLKNGIQIDESIIFDNTLTRVTGENSAEEISKMNPMPDGIFAASDFSAVGALIKLKKLGIRVPEEVAIIGFANEPFDDMLETGISSIDQHSIEIGETAANILFKAIQENSGEPTSERIILKPDIFIRSSTQRS